MKEKCRFCQSQNLKIFLKSKKRTLVECQDCGLVFVSPFPTKAEVKAIYTEKAFERVDPIDSTRAGYGHYLAEEDFRRELFKDKVSLIKKFKKKGKLLDVGCGIGTFLEEARKARLEVNGVDIMAFAVKRCHKRGLKKVYQGTLERKRFPSSSFDVVTAFEILEHLQEPKNLLSEAKRILRPKGILVISVPDRKSLLARLIGKCWYGYLHYQHLFVFEKKTLGNYLIEKDFKILQWGKDRLAWCLVKNALNRVKFYYSNPVLLKLVNLSEHLFDLLRIKRIPIYLGSIWMVAQKK